MPPLLSIIIPVYGQWPLTRQCLTSLAEHRAPVPTEIIVVDNGSPDATPQELAPLGQTLFGSAFRVIRNETNLGFAPACNQGAHQAQGTFLFFLNNDTIALPGWAQPLLEQLNTTGGIVGSRLLYPGAERVQHVGVAFTPGPKVCHVFEQFPATHPAAQRRREVQAVTGAALALPRRLFEDLHGFDEGFHNGLEDVDLCLRARDAGRSIVCEPRSTLIHLTSQTPGRFAAETANAQRFAARWMGRIRPDFHRHLEAEGYIMGLSASLHPIMLLPASSQNKLLERSRHISDPRLLLDAIIQEPLWEPGYDRLASWLEGRNAWTEAAALRLLAAQFFPKEQHFLALAKAATRAGDTALARHAGRLLEQERLAASRLPELIAYAQHLSAQLTAQGDLSLAQLYALWAQTNAQ